MVVDGTALRSNEGRQADSSYDEGFDQDRELLTKLGSVPSTETDSINSFVGRHQLSHRLTVMFSITARKAKLYL